MSYLEWKDLDFTQHRLLFPLPSLSEAADLLRADFSPHAGFLVCFDHGGLMRCGSLDRPSLRYRPAALLSGGDQQYLEVILARSKRQSCKLFELHRANSKALEHTALALVPEGSGRVQVVGRLLSERIGRRRISDVGVFVHRFRNAQLARTLRAPTASRSAHRRRHRRS